MFLKSSESAQDQINIEVQAWRGEDLYVNPEQFPEPNNKYGLFCGTTCKADDKEADKIYKQVDRTTGCVGAHRKACKAELAMNRAEYPKL
ncbi:hypothetical protein V8E53_006111 [Lactarius tabidus]